jgi:hypothetical protein
MRATRKSGISSKKVIVCIEAIIIVTTMGAMMYKGEFWEAWSVSAEQNTKMMREAAGKSGILLNSMIRNVSYAKTDELTPIVEVTGAVKVSAQQKAFFDKLNHLELKPHKQFSYSEWFAGVEPKLNDKPTEAAYSYSASLLYEAAVKSGFQTGERHLHQQLPEYASPGFDVFVRPGRNDLSLYNPKEFSARVSISYTDDVPRITLSAGAASGWKVVQSSIKQTYYKPENVDILDRSLALGTQAIHQAGQAGQLVEVTIGDQALSKDFYLPSPTIIGHGPLPDEPNTEHIRPKLD